MIMMVIMPCLEIMPVIAEGGEAEISAEGWINGEWTAEPTGLNINPYVDKLYISTTEPNEQGKGEAFTASPINFAVEDGASQELYISMDYNLSRSVLEQKGFLRTDNPEHFIQFKLNDSDFEILQGHWGQNQKVFDGDRIAGYYSLSKTAGLLTVRLTDEYLSYLQSQTSGCKGSIMIGGKVQKGEGESAVREVSIGNFEINVDFPDRVPEISKTAVSASDNSIVWEIKVKNPDGAIDMSGAKIKDVLKNDENTTVAWGSDNIEIDVSASTAGITLTNEGFAIPESAKNDPEITIRYTQKNAEQNVTYSNSASLQREGKTDIPTGNTPTFKIENKLSISKNGTPDYANGVPNNEIIWNIQVANQQGKPLNSVIVDDKDFDFTENNIVEVKKPDGTPINSNQYSIDDGNIVFADNVDFSNATIIFKTPVDKAKAKSENGYKVTNKVEATSSESVNPPQGSGEVTSPEVTYKYNFSVNKKTGQTTSNTTEQVQWEIDIIADYGPNSTVNLDGYYITDAAFKDKTINFDNNAGGITYNVFSRNYNSNAKEKVVLTGPDEDGKIKININGNEPVYRITFFVTQPYSEATYSEGDHAAYLKGEKVTMTNTADGGNSTIGVHASDTVDYTTKMTDDVYSKSYDGDNTPIYVMGNPEDEATIKILPWSVIAQRDGKINNTVTVTDVLVEPISGSHYITPAQAAENNWLTVVKSSNSAFSSSETVDPDLYEIKFYETADSSTPIENFTAQTEKNAQKIEVRFTGDLGVNYVKLSYSSTADVSKINVGTTGQFNNKAKTKGDYKEAQGLTFTREDPSKPTYFKIHVNKIWSDALNVNGNRPRNLKFIVKRTTDDPDSDTASWENVKTVEVNLNDNNDRNDIGLKDSNYQDIQFPQWDENGKRYYYKVDEEMPEDSGYHIKSQDPPFKAEFNDGYTKTYAINNAPEATLKKYAIDSDNNVVTSLKPSQIPRETINGTECYMFQWKVETLIPNHSPETHFYETLPEDAIFVTLGLLNSTQLSYTEKEKYSPKKIFPYYTGSWTTNANDLSAVQNEQNVTITAGANLGADLKGFTYYIAIPVSKYPNIDSNDEVITNTIRDAENNEATANLTVTNNTSSEPDEPENPSAISKSYIPAKQRGSISYRLDINPEEDDISAGDTIQITDKLSMASQTPSLKDVEVSLASIKVHEYVNGTDTDPVITNFNYISKDKEREEKECTVTADIQPDGNNKSSIWEVFGWEEGDQLTFDLEAIAGRSINAKIVCAAKEQGYEPYNSDPAVNKSTVDVSTNTATITIPSGTKRVYVYEFRYSGANLQNVTVSAKSKEYPSILNIEVPDEKHVWVEYTYNVTGYPTYQISKVTNNDNVQCWKISGFQSGDSISAIINRASGVPKIDGDVKYLISNNANVSTNNIENDSNWQEFKGEKITVTAKNDEKYLYIVDLGKKKGNEYALESIQAAPSVRFSNSASYNESNGSGSAVSENNEMQVSYSSMSIQAEKYPEIYKTDVGSDNINTLPAKFKVAKYVKNVGWVYASDIVTRTDESNKKARKLIFPNENDGYTEINHQSKPSEKTYPVNAVTLEFNDTDSTSDNSIHNFILDDNEVYKFVEIVAPEGYLQPDWTKGGFETNKDFVFCYAYGSVVKSNYSADIVNNLRTWTKQSRLNIPNSSRISLSAKKEFSGANPPESSEVKLALYYATNADGKNKKIVNEAFLALTDGEKNVYKESHDNTEFTFTNPVTLSYDSAKDANIVSWEQLPTGKDGTPLYYFVVEESYTLTENGTDKTYKLDTADGKYYEYNTSTNSFVENGNERNVGKYRPITDNKGTRTNGAVISINNSEGIIIRKTWRDTNKNLVSPPSENGSPMQITFKVSAKLNGKDVELDLGSDNKLSETNNYQLKLPDPVSVAEPEDDAVKTAIGYTSGKTYQLKEFTSFTVEEVLIDQQKTALTNAGYLIDQIKVSGNATDGFGAYEIINTKQADDAVTEASVEKIWSGTPRNSVTVKLIQTTEQLTANVLRSLSASEYTSINGNDSFIVISPNGTKTHTFEKSIKEAKPDAGFTAVVNSNNDKQLDITAGANECSGIVRVTFDDDTQKNIRVTVLSQTAVLTTGNWTKAWEGLPSKNSNNVPYYYYIIEPEVPNGYTASYAVSDGKTTITNTQKTVDLQVRKEWADSDIIDHSGETIKFVIKRSTDPNAVPNGAGEVYNGTTYDISVTTTKATVTTTEATTTTAAVTTEKSLVLNAPQSLNKGETGQISVNKTNISDTENVTYKYSSDGTNWTDSSDIVSISGNTITANSAGTVYIKAVCDGIEPNVESNEVTVTVSENANPPSDEDEITISITQKGDINIADFIGSHSISDIKGYKLTFKDKSATNAQVTCSNWKINQSCSGIDLNESNSIIFTFNTDSGEKATEKIVFFDYGNNIPYPIELTIYFTTPSPSSSPAPPTYKYRNNLQTLLPYTTAMSEAPSKAKIKRPLRGGSITKTVGAEAEESKVTELFFNTNVSDIIEMGAGIQSVPSMNLSLIGGKVKLSAAKQGTEEDAWTKVISGLPAADANGNTYYYWIEEIPVDGYIASYKNNGINAVSAAGTQTITITNTKDTSPPTLPEAGSTGTKFYTAIGGIMLILSAAGYTTIKRRRWFEE